MASSLDQSSSEFVSSASAALRAVTSPLLSIVLHGDADKAYDGSFPIGLRAYVGLDVDPNTGKYISEPAKDLVKRVGATQLFDRIPVRCVGDSTILKFSSLLPSLNLSMSIEHVWR